MIVKSDLIRKQVIKQRILYYAPFLNGETLLKAVEYADVCSEAEFAEKPDSFNTNVYHEKEDISVEINPSFASYLNGSSFCAFSEENIQNEEKEEVLSKARTEILLRDLERTIESLQLSGLSLAAIHEFIDKRQTISRMVITADYRILLPDYNNMEIELTALPKALFFLFLRYPEGIVLKELQDHYTELLNIYRQLRPGEPESKIALSVTRIVNPLSNSIHENMARIRRAFVGKFDEHLSKNYIITGRSSEAYAIPLDRNLVIWEE